MGKRTLIILFALLALISVSACTGSSSPPSVTETPAPIGPFKFPSMTPVPGCLPPCFHGLVPGKTSQAEALSLLHAVPSQVDSAFLYWDTDDPKTWYNSITFRDGVVQVIRLMYASRPTFQDVIDSNGLPEIVIAGRPGGEAGWDDFLLAYPSRGLAYQGGIPLSSLPQDRLTPTPDTIVESVIYFAPEAKDKLSVDDVSHWLITSFPSIHPWRGFGVPYTTPEE